MPSATPSPAVLIHAFTDFGWSGPYMGQMEAVLRRNAPGVGVVRLMADAPRHDPRAAAYLLAALLGEPRGGPRPGDVVLAVVDPGVGTSERIPVAGRVDGTWLVGPDNGLFSIAARRAGLQRWWRLEVPETGISASFHGRDVFAPFAARLALGQAQDGLSVPTTLFDPGWPDDLPEVIHVDGFGNAMTGLRARVLPSDALLRIGGRTIGRARVFGERAPGAPLWYENSLGLVEIAVNRGNASRELGLVPGIPIEVERS